VAAATSGWRAAAQKAGIARAGIARMTAAFEHEQAEAASALAG